MELLQIHGLVTAYVFIVGLAIGSFLNVCIYRLPRDESILFPRSHCPSCNAQIRARDNIPVISYLVLAGKCRHCRSAISPVYPAVEIVTGALLAVLYYKFGFTWQTLIYAVVLPALVVITMIDLEHKIIPDIITLPGIIFGLAAGYYLVGWRDSLIGLAVGGGLFYLLAVLSRGGMGGGDIKFIAGAGALLGWQKVLLIIFLGAFLGSCVGLPLILMKKKSRKSQIPFGPFLAAGTLIAIFFGNDLIRLYLGTVTGVF
ncbi:MAG: prepilin peptidase [Nitrospinales bacterium]